MDPYLLKISKSNNGITIIDNKVSVWLDLQNKSNQHPLLRSNLSGKIRNIQSISGIKGKGIGRTYQLALINVSKRLFLPVSLVFIPLRVLGTM